MRRLTPVAFALLAASCAEATPRPTRPAVPIKSACTAGSRPASSVGLDVRPGRRHSDARTIFVTNVGDRPRAVEIQRVTRTEGACGGEWARTTALDFADEATQAAPEARGLPPRAELQLRIGPQRAAGTWGCVKLGLSIWMKVDDEIVCADAGAWIAERDADD